ncbi:sugar phosphate isomerase/epimerase family protein [Dictyobacter kobayashii]|uniref:Sugar phosphate isomerase n=1 Tax=Dictyobacter kobayashii TaxID=2014872 RepID=A0A402ATY0_9CHLR|nr:TIM barrel protein [Dictyobacter kobayashii]GCE22544.1 sugar phosphate isomerase [Dictyobacter kobayashii]
MTPIDKSISPLRFSVSTWSLHRTLGDYSVYGPDAEKSILESVGKNGQLSLLELPARLAAFGISTLEICHFHLPSLDAGYLSELRATLEHEKIELFSLLVDAGDITHPQHAERDLAWIRSWLGVAGQLGAKRSRVIAGKSEPTAENLQTSVHGLRQLADTAEGQGVRLMTENWFGLLSQPTAIHTVFEQLEGRLGLCFDFGNWSGPTKYEDLTSIAPYAESCHTKAHFSTNDELDSDDYIRCLDITRAAGFSGPYTLIYDGPNPDEWNGLSRERQIVAPYIHP